MPEAIEKIIFECVWQCKNATAAASRLAKHVEKQSGNIKQSMQKSFQACSKAIEPVSKQLEKTTKAASPKLIELAKKDYWKFADAIKGLPLDELQKLYVALQAKQDQLSKSSGKVTATQKKLGWSLALLEQRINTVKEQTLGYQKVASQPLSIYLPIGEIENLATILKRTREENAAVLEDMKKGVIKPGTGPFGSQEYYESVTKRLDTALQNVNQLKAIAETPAIPVVISKEQFAVMSDLLNKMNLVYDRLETIKDNLRELPGLVSKPIPEMTPAIEVLDEEGKAIAKITGQTKKQTKSISRRYATVTGLYEQVLGYYGIESVRLRYIARDLMRVGYTYMWMGGAAAGVFATMIKGSGELADALEEVWELIEDIAAPIGDVLAPVFETIADVLENVAMLFEDLPAPLKMIIGAIILGTIAWSTLAFTIMRVVGTFMLLRFGLVDIYARMVKAGTAIQGMEKFFIKLAMAISDPLMQLFGLSQMLRNLEFQTSTLQEVMQEATSMMSQFSTQVQQTEKGMEVTIQLTGEQAQKFVDLINKVKETQVQQNKLVEGQLQIQRNVSPTIDLFKKFGGWIRKTGSNLAQSHKSIGKVSNAIGTMRNKLGVVSVGWNKLKDSLSKYTQQNKMLIGVHDMFSTSLKFLAKGLTAVAAGWIGMVALSEAFQDVMEAIEPVTEAFTDALEPWLPLIESVAEAIADFIDSLERFGILGKITQFFIGLIMVLTTFGMILGRPTLGIDLLVRSLQKLWKGISWVRKEIPAFRGEMKLLGQTFDELSGKITGTTMLLGEVPGTLRLPKPPEPFVWSSKELEQAQKQFKDLGASAQLLGPVTSNLQLLGNTISQNLGTQVVQSTKRWGIFSRLIEDTSGTLKLNAKGAYKLASGFKSMGKFMFTTLGFGVALFVVFEMMEPIIDALSDAMTTVLEPLEPIVDMVADFIDEHPELAMSLLLGMIVASTAAFFGLNKILTKFGGLMSGATDATQVFSYQQAAVIASQATLIGAFASLVWALAEFVKVSGEAGMSFGEMFGMLIGGLGTVLAFAVGLQKLTQILGPIEGMSAGVMVALGALVGAFAGLVYTLGQFVKIGTSVGLTIPEMFGILATGLGIIVTFVAILVKLTSYLGTLGAISIQAMLGLSVLVGAFSLLVYTIGQFVSLSASAGLSLTEMISAFGALIGIATGMIAVLAYVTKFLSSMGAVSFKGALVLVLITTAVAGLVYVLGMLASTISSDAIGPLMALVSSVVVLMGVMAGFVKILGNMSKDVFIGITAMFLLVGAFAALTYVLKDFIGYMASVNVSLTDIFQPLVVLLTTLVGLTIAMGAVAEYAIIGAAAFAVLGGSLWVLSIGLKALFESLQPILPNIWDIIAGLAGLLGVLLGFSVAFGALLPLVAMGSASFAALGGSLIVLSMGFDALFNSLLPVLPNIWDLIGGLSALLGTILGFSIAFGVLLPFMAMAAVSFVMLGGALSSFLGSLGDALDGFKEHIETLPDFTSALGGLLNMLLQVGVGFGFLAPFIWMGSAALQSMIGPVVDLIKAVGNLKYTIQDPIHEDFYKWNNSMIATNRTLNSLSTPVSTLIGDISGLRTTVFDTTSDIAVFNADMENSFNGTYGRILTNTNQFKSDGASVFQNMFDDISSMSNMFSTSETEQFSNMFSTLEGNTSTFKEGQETQFGEMFENISGNTSVFNVDMTSQWSEIFSNVSGSIDSMTGKMDEIITKMEDIQTATGTQGATVIDIWESLKIGLGSIIDDIMGFFGQLKDVIVNAFEGLGDWLNKNVWQPIQDGWNSLTSTVGGALESAGKTVSDGIAGIGNTIITGVQGFVDAVGNIFCVPHTIINAIYDAISPVKTATRKLGEVMLGEISNVVSKSKNLLGFGMKMNYGLGVTTAPSMQEGGYVRKAGLYFLHPGETVVPAGEGRTGPIVYMTNYITIQPREVSPRMSDTEKRELADEISRYIENRLRKRLS